MTVLQLYLHMALKKLGWIVWHKQINHTDVVLPYDDDDDDNDDDCYCYQSM